ncbi:3-dehydroquinate synthase [hydrothermal vent metagenome]|uniref:3-dehydroquinate synthase n=1 Tax=hydrothermal vent metagenome TaxID=652676 RepID=A0A3B0UIY4_9ZZZZ
MQKEPVLLDLKSIPHIVGQGALERAGAYFSGYTDIFVLVDENTEKFCLPVLRNILPGSSIRGVIKIKSGELNKNIRTASAIWEQLTHFKAERNSLLINLGGGVITDIGGFVAATFKRGMAFVNIPTTLLGQVDAAIGSKTGIDFKEYKNQIGLFADPKVVVIDPVFLDTLDPKQFLSGFAEMLKYALIMDIPLWEIMDNRYFDAMYPDLERMVVRCVGDKISIVEEDKHESGLRKLLNFGHTVGHALETFFLKTDTPVTHGEAVAAGMICATRISSQHPDFECHSPEQIYEMIDRNFPRLTFLQKDILGIMRLMQQDKKTKAGQLHFTLLTKLGTAVPDVVVPEEKVKESLRFYLRNQ